MPDAPDPRLNAESLAIREAIMNPTFAASLVQAGITVPVARELALSSGGEAVNRAKLDAAYALGAFLVKHFTTETKDDTNIIIQVRVDLLVPTEKVPKGMAHTPIVFKENRP